MDCGAGATEREHFSKHTYAEYEIFPGLNLVLCDFCDVDFGSYKPEYFGLRGRAPDVSKMQFVRDITQPQLVQDKVCPSCERRLPFLRFLVNVRKLAAEGGPNKSAPRYRGHAAVGKKGAASRSGRGA
jgi:hypothetical protein